MKVRLRATRTSSLDFKKLLSPRQQGSRPRIKRDCETVVFGAVEQAIVPQAAPVVGVPRPLNPVRTVNASVWTTTGVQTPCDRFSVGVSVSWGRRTRRPTAGSRRPWHETGFQRVALNRRVAPRIACCTREAERCAIASARSARPPALPRSRRRAHHMDLPHMRPDRVRAAPQFSLHHARRAGDRANLQHDIALPGAYAARAAPVSSAHPGCLDAVTVLSRFDPASQKRQSITDETTVFRDELLRQPVLGDRQARRPQ
jgi:hypothetical protein